MTEIYVHPSGGKLYIGDDNDFTKTEDKSGFSFVRCCKEGPGGHRALLGYKTVGAPKDSHYQYVIKGNILAINILDLDDPHFMPDDGIDHALEFIGKKLADGNNVLVACNQGHSRGPSVALLYLETIGEFRNDVFRNAEKVMKALYPKYDPGQGVEQYTKMKYAKLRYKNATANDVQQ